MNNRKFIRHPSDIAIEVRSETLVTDGQEYLCDVGMGGICFKTDGFVEKDTVIRIRIPGPHGGFETKGKVVWCRQKGDHFNVGVEFTEPEDAFRARMIEQVCHIEHYRKRVLDQEGRSLSSSEAALEWISKYAGSFPGDSEKKKPEE